MARADDKIEQKNNRREASRHMLRTPIRTKFSKQLIRINDQICFAALGRREFGETIDRLAQASPEQSTTTVFASNPYASRLHRKIEEIPTFAAKSEQIELQMGVIAGCEHAIAYLKEIEVFRAAVKPGPADALKADAIEDRLLQKLAEWLGTAPVKGPYLTLGYLRLLRNHYGHVNEVKTSAFTKYIANYAHYLQTFWNNGRTDIGPLIFRTLPDGPLSPEACFAIMNLLRICIEEIDADFVRTLTVPDVLEHMVAQVHERDKPRSNDPEWFTKRVRAAIFGAYGEEPDAVAVRKATDAFLAARKKGAR